MSGPHHYQQLITLFNHCFSSDFQTCLIRGGDEPVYLPADATSCWNRIVFAHGFYASALHEIAHWCIAGPARRKLIDFGYWYCPDGRDVVAQNRFESAEIKPQALEWLFCMAADFPFNVSCDNLNGEFQPDPVAFHRKVHQQVLIFLEKGILSRSARFIEALRSYYKTPPLLASQFLYPPDM